MNNLCNFIVKLANKHTTSSQIYKEISKLSPVVHMDIYSLVALYPQLTDKIIFDTYQGIPLEQRYHRITRSEYLNRFTNYAQNLGYFRINDRKCIQAAGSLSYLYTVEHYVNDPLTYPDDNISRLNLFHDAKCENIA